MNQLRKSNQPVLHPLFDSLDCIQVQTLSPVYQDCPDAQANFQQARAFLLSYQGNAATFQAYRREVERLLQWAWLIAQKSVRSLGRAEIEAYVAFCQNPPRSWTGIKKAPRFLDKGGTRVPNSDWRPFVATVAKAAHGRGQRPQLEDYALSPKALAGIFAITGSFYQFLIQEGYTEVNPLLMIRQKSRYSSASRAKAKSGACRNCSGTMLLRRRKLWRKNRHSMSARCSSWRRFMRCICASRNWRRVRAGFPRWAISIATPMACGGSSPSGKATRNGKSR